MKLIFAPRNKKGVKRILRASDFLSIYRADGLVKTIAAGIHAPNEKNIRIIGLSGSLDAVLLATIFKIHHEDCIVVLQDREEAAYFQNDLQNLLEREVFLF